MIYHEEIVPKLLGTDHYFSIGGSHFGKINRLDTKSNEKNCQQKNFFKKNCLHNIGKVGKSSFL